MSKTLVVIEGENASQVRQELSLLTPDPLEDVVAVSWQAEDELSGDGLVLRTDINNFQPDPNQDYIIAFTPQVFDGTMQTRLTARFIRADPRVTFQVWRRNRAGVWSDITNAL